ncbi:MAG: outer membrane lipoprotein-sorting protein [Myxococcales bacterium]|nr:MAG: outer membrane lipoprotein-sorting protein [Myxococcales bacterium]
MNGSRPTKSLVIGLLALVLFLVPQALSAQEQAAGDAAAKEKLSPQQILEKMDAFTNGFDDQEMRITWLIYDVNGSTKSYDSVIQQKGRNKRLIRLTSGELKDMAILTEDENRMYVYLPGYKRIRRIANHGMKQSFVGSDYTNADMSTANYADKYDAKLEKEDEKFWWLRLDPKPGADMDYGHLVMKIGKDVFRMWGASYYDKQGRHVKEFSIRDVKKFPRGVEWPEYVQMADPQTGHRTELHIKEFIVNQGLKDSLFTQRSLQWSR